MRDKTIHPNQGVGKLKFGLSEEEVKQILGLPDETDTMTHDDGTASLLLMYYDLGLHLSFDSDNDYNLTEIEIDSDEYKLDGKIQVGSTKDELLAYISSKGYDDPYVEDVSTDDEPGMELVALDEIGLNFWLEDNEINSIQVGLAEEC
jgi:hypothetical protein